VCLYSQLPSGLGKTVETIYLGKRHILRIKPRLQTQ
jgi:hypothetical protein